MLQPTKHSGGVACHYWHYNILKISVEAVNHVYVLCDQFKVKLVERKAESQKSKSKQTSEGGFYLGIYEAQQREWL